MAELSAKKDTRRGNQARSTTVMVTRASVVFIFLCIPSIFLLAPRTTSVVEILSSTWRPLTTSIDDYGSRPPLSTYQHSHYLSSTVRLSTLNVASRVTVISLPHRIDRRARMELLSSVLGLEFTYFDAFHSTNPSVDIIMDSVRRLRISHTADFVWPQAEEVDKIAYSLSLLGKDGSDLWEDDVLSGSSSPLASGTNDVPLTDAHKNDSVEPYRPDLPPHRILTSGKIACWYSHSKAIRQIAEGAVKNRSEVTVVLEDDIDMELDIRQRLVGLWDSLPYDWDIVFLGHCWSDESLRPAIGVYNGSLSWTTSFLTALHPSVSPKCTHGYALTTQGARRLAVYLRYPPFAYSRAVDQAIAWLVESGKLKSYSLVPSVVVQRKADKSDILDGFGSSWKDELRRGVFG